MANTDQDSSQTAPIEFDRNKSLKRIHDIGWGKPWPTKLCTIDRHEILLNETDDGGSHKEMCVDYADNSDIPATETFKCLLNVDLLRTALEFIAPSQRLQAIVILREYENLREALENDSLESYFVVTGQPGTGNTLFILYLLLYRLEKKLPTAVQFLATKYIFFDAEGGSLRSTISVDSEALPPGCWCLCDGNPYVDFPCYHFMQSLRTLLVTSASPETYKKWRNQMDATTLVKAPPRTVEMAAIAKMHGFRPCDAVSVSQRWGPNIRTIFAILRDRRKEKVFWDHAARRIYQDSVRMVANDTNKPADKKTSSTWLQKFLNLW